MARDTKMSNFARKIKDHIPDILTGFGIGGMIAAGVYAVKQTPKALELIEQRKEELNVPDLNRKETIKATWKLYLPSAIVGIGSGICIIAGSHAKTKRYSMLSAAYSLSELTLREYKDAVIETIGEKKIVLPVRLVERGSVRALGT